MSGFSIESYLLETLAWTAALIALVLVLRRPVTRWFGPQVAYALWALPVLRLIVPPIELPAWMRPAPEPSSAGATAPVAHYTFPGSLDPVTPVATPSGASEFEAAATDLSTAITPQLSWDWSSMIEPLILPALVLWLIGAAIFLYRRFAAYFELRDQLLTDARDVGREGKVRLIETPATDAPLAFGVIDKVIALPPGFLAQPDRQARDLALAHELAHHKGQDLLVNVVVQPLFALHWFNPLGRYGWLALRRDQEAACDARVIAGVMAVQEVQERAETREAYANLIVSYAAVPSPISDHALTAPMACRVLGEKSIIHRLRSLKMTDTPKSRRLAGRVMLGAAVLALPLTASISYAASEAPPPEPVFPVASVAAPGAPLPPAPSAPPAPPLPPVAPLAPDAIKTIDPDTMSDAEIRRIEASIEQREAEIEEMERRIERRYLIAREGQRGSGMSEEEMEVVMIELREGLEQARATIDELPAIIEQSLQGIPDANGKHVTVEMTCDGAGSEPATTIENADGTHVVKLCRTRIMAQALDGLREARDEIANESDMDAEMRARVLRELDAQIKRWESTRG